jgi:tetratricopeptide (TPR) repeat protein
MGRTRLRMVARCALPIAAIAGVLFVRHFRGRPFEPSYLDAALRAADALSYRAFDGRLAGDFPYKPRETHPRGASHETGDRRELLALVAKLDAMRDGSPDRRLGLGASLLLLGRTPEAIEALDGRLGAAGIRDCTDPALLTDLSVAYGERAKTSGGPRDLLAATEASQRAWMLDPSPATTWNRAVALEAVALLEDARAAWEEFLRIDGASPWAAEARQHLQSLQRRSQAELWNAQLRTFDDSIESGNLAYIDRAAEQFPQDARRYAEETLFERWAESTLAGHDAAAQRTRRAIERIAALRKAKWNDAMLAEAVHAIDAQPDRRDLAEGQKAYVEGQRLVKNRQVERAELRFQEAVRLLGRAGSPMADLASIEWAACEYNKNQYDEALRLIEGVAERIGTGRYPAARARAHWIAGISESSKSYMHAAIDHYSAASRLYSQIGEADNVASMTGLLATTYDTIGARDRGWSLRFTTLRSMADAGSSDRLPQTLQGAAVAAERDGFVLTAIAFLDREIAVTREPRWLDVRALALARRSALRHLMRQRREASADLAAAQAAVDSIDDASIREFVSTHPWFVRAALASVADRTERLAALRSAYDFAAKKGIVYRQIELLLDSASEESAAGDVHAASSSLDQVLTLVESERSRLPDLQSRDAHLDQRQNVYRELVRISAERGDFDSALRYAERGRARSLREAFEGTTALAPVAFESIRARIPADTAVVYFATLPDRLLIWIITATSVTLHQQNIGAGDLSRLVGRGVAEAGPRIGDPWTRAVAGYSTVVIVPDNPLHNISFAALRVGDRYLVESHRVIIAPSLAMFIRCLDRDAAMAARSRGGVLLVSAGGFQSAAGLEPLPMVHAEIASILRVERSAVVLQDPAVTKQQFLREASAAAIIHYAGHVVTNDQKPSYSALVFPHGASEPEEYVYAHEVSAIRLPETRLVVLSACDSLKASDRAQNGVSSLGRAFIAAGVPAVIGTLRPVDDALAAEVFRLFYVRLHAGDDPATALQAAQLQMIRRGTNGDWAAFYLAGGVQRRRETS